MKNIAKDKILNNELCLGVGLRQTRTVDIGKIMATCDYDWLFIDMEHNSMDVDIASESTALAKYNILVQASASMLSQANATSNVAMMLLN